MAQAEAKGSGRLLLAMALASGITSVPNAAIVLALPTIHHQFDASLTELEWTVLAGVRGAAESYDETASRQIDYRGLALSAAGLGAITLALNEAPTPWALGSAKFVLVLAGGVLLLAGFALVERRIRDPLIDLAMFARRNLTGASIVVFVLDFAFGAVLFFVPLYLEEVLGFDALKAGLLLLPASVTMMIAMPFGGRLFERLGPVPPIVAGMALAGVAMLLLGNISTSTHYADLWPPLALLGLGIGSALTPMNLAALNAMPARNHGAVAAIITTFGGLGATFGVALSGAVFEVLQTDRTVTAAANRGVQLTDAGARTLDGLLAGTPTATHALASYPASQHALLMAAIDPLPRPNVTEPFSGLAPRP